MTSANAAQPAWATDESPSAGLAERVAEVKRHFPNALCVYDYMSRVEAALAGYGFTGDNSIAMANLCRDESCVVLEDAIESAFGSCFSTHGLGGVLTCGLVGMQAGLSHSPLVGGRERYVFFSFPHIAIDSEGRVGSLSRPNRPGSSPACGALVAALADLQRDGLQAHWRAPGLHDPLDPEYSILKQRIARRLAFEGMDPAAMTLVEFTQAAERVLSMDLEHLISKAVDPSVADYAVFTGVQIHNWAADLNVNPEPDPNSGVNPDLNRGRQSRGQDPHLDAGQVRHESDTGTDTGTGRRADTPSLELVAPSLSYVVVNGEMVHLDLEKLPAQASSPQQPQALPASASATGGSRAATSAAASASCGRAIREIPRDYLMRRLGGVRSSVHSHDPRREGT